jgi:hypothetical protein
MTTTYKFSADLSREKHKAGKAGGFPVQYPEFPVNIEQRTGNPEDESSL